METSVEEAKNLRQSRYLRPLMSSLATIVSKKNIVSNVRFKEFSDFCDYMVQGRISRKWKRCQVTVKDKVLKIYKNLESRQPNISINFETVSCKIFVIANSYLEIQPVNFSKSLLIQPFSEEKIQDLCITLSLNLERSIGFNVCLDRLTQHSRKFWKKSYITREQFYNTSENGDLVLFKSSSFGSFALRVASNSEFDHVALIVRGKKGEVFIYECVGSGGVQINNVDFFLDNDWDKFYKKIAIRKLHCDRSKDFTKAFSETCSKFIGKPYKLSAEKLMRKESLNIDNIDFFCSELVAAVYKKLKLLPNEISACQYWPSSFSANHKLELLNGAYLGEEMRIIFFQ